MALSPLKLVELAAKKAPTTNPGIVGKLWVNGNILQISAGAPQLVGSPNAGKTAIELFGVIPAANTTAFYTRLDAIENQRLIDVPLVKPNGQTYYFATSGSDSNVGSQASPWQTLSRANSILNPLPAMVCNGRQLSVASTTPFAVGGRSFWCGGWVKNTSANSYGAIVTRDYSYGLITDINDSKPRLVKTDLNDTVCVWPVAVAQGDTWAYVEAWFDSSTGVASLCVNDGTPVTAAGQSFSDSGAGSFFAGHGSYGGMTGDVCKTFFVRDYAPSNANRTAMYNSGKGNRSYTLPSSLRTILSSNSGEFWDQTGVNGTTVYPGLFGKDLTASSGQNPVVVLAPDADAVISVSAGRIAGGGGITCLFNRGDFFTGKIQSTRRSISLGAYGSGPRPVLSTWHITVPNVWTATNAHFKVSVATDIGWVEPVNDYAIWPRARELRKAVSAASCDATANSFFYDFSAKELHVNVGVNPATYAPEGWRACDYITTANVASIPYGFGTTNAHNLRIEDLQIDGGVTEPGNISTYGIIIQQNAVFEAIRPECVVKNCRISGGYHNVGFFGVGHNSLLIDTYLDLMCGRNETGNVGDFSGTSWVSFGDDQEVILRGNTIGGFRQSWDQGTAGAMTSGIVHGTGSDIANLIVDRNTYYSAAKGKLRSGALLGVTDSADWLNLYPCYVINSTYDTATYPNSLGWCAGAININFRMTDYAVGLPGYLFYNNYNWAINCTLLADFENVDAPTYFFRAPNSDLRVNLLHCYMDVKNVRTATTSKIVAMVATVSGDGIKNSIITMAGAGTLSVGDLVAGKSISNAFFGTTGPGGTGEVALSAKPSLTINPNGASQLIGGATSGTQYDRALSTRATNDIGPLKAV